MADFELSRSTHVDADQTTVHALVDHPQGLHQKFSVLQRRRGRRLRRQADVELLRDAGQRIAWLDGVDALIRPDPAGAGGRKDSWR